MRLKKPTRQISLSGFAFEDWDFKTANTGELTHAIHPYPARMVPQIASRLVRRFSSKDGRVFDPFCGSGTVTLESARLGRSSFSSDINPLAVLITKVKCTPLEDRKIEELVVKVTESLRETDSRASKIGVPQVPNLNYWFKEDVINDLASIGLAIRRVEMNDEYRDFFNLCMSGTIYDVGNLDKRDNPYFLRTLKGDRLASFKPKTVRTFMEKLDSARSRIRELSKSIRESETKYVQPRIVLRDSRGYVEEIGGFDLLLTSPPYGEEKNTMSYMRFAKLACNWLGYTPAELRKFESLSLGHNARSHTEWRPPSAELRNLLSSLRERGREDRASDVSAFFEDYFDLLVKAVNHLEKGGHFCIVIGNRTANGTPVRNDLVTQELCTSAGMTHVVTHYRNIPKKALPRSDGKVELINAESIVVMKKV